MKHLFLSTSIMFLILLGCNTQSSKNDSNKLMGLNDLHSLPTEAEWKAAALPTEDEWKKAATLDKNLNAN